MMVTIIYSTSGTLRESNTRRVQINMGDCRNAEHDNPQPVRD
jgi:hypothetical protein